VKVEKTEEPQKKDHKCKYETHFSFVILLMVSLICILSSNIMFFRFVLIFIGVLKCTFLKI
jgi:hypothetical protein